MQDTQLQAAVRPDRAVVGYPYPREVIPTGANDASGVDTRRCAHALEREEI